VVMGLILIDGVIALDRTELHYSGYGVCRPQIWGIGNLCLGVCKTHNTR
jgi:hypothetical protein